MCLFSSDYQTDLMSISASWETDGDPCPAVSYQWAIERVDGLRIQEFTETYGETTILNTMQCISKSMGCFQFMKGWIFISISFIVKQ